MPCAFRPLSVHGGRQSGYTRTCIGHAQKRRYVTHIAPQLKNPPVVDRFTNQLRRVSTHTAEDRGTART